MNIIFHNIAHFGTDMWHSDNAKIIKILISKLQCLKPRIENIKLSVRAVELTPRLYSVDIRVPILCSLLPQTQAVCFATEIHKKLSYKVQSVGLDNQDLYAINRIDCKSLRVWQTLLVLWWTYKYYKLEKIYRQFLSQIWSYNNCTESRGVNVINE